MVHVCKKLTLLGSAGAILKLKKCRFFADNIDYIEHVIRPRRLNTTSLTTDAARDFQAPTPQAELRSVIGL